MKLKPADRAAVEALLAPWTGPHHGAPPFDRVRAELFEPAFSLAIAAMHQEVATIADDQAQPNFANTIEALERSGWSLGRLESLFSVMTSNMNDPAYQALSRKIEPMLSQAFDRVFFNRPLFQRIEAVYRSRDTAQLSAEQRRLLEEQYESFVRRGARLDPAQKDQLGAINKELATLFADFANRVQADEDTWVTLGKKTSVGCPRRWLPRIGRPQKSESLMATLWSTRDRRSTRF